MMHIPVGLGNEVPWEKEEGPRLEIVTTRAALFRSLARSFFPGGTRAQVPVG